MSMGPSPMHSNLPHASCPLRPRLGPSNILWHRIATGTLLDAPETPWRPTYPRIQVCPVSLAALPSRLQSAPVAKTSTSLPAPTSCASSIMCELPISRVLQYGKLHLLLLHLHACFWRKLTAGFVDLFLSHADAGSCLLLGQSRLGHGLFVTAISVDCLSTLSLSMWFNTAASCVSDSRCIAER